jgi:hypothetical protein
MRQYIHAAVTLSNGISFRGRLISSHSTVCFAIPIYMGPELHHTDADNEILQFFMPPLILDKVDTFTLSAANPQVIGLSFGAIAETHILDATRDNVVGLVQMPPHLFARWYSRPFALAMERVQRVK